MAKLRFRKRDHTYWLGRKELESVTTFIGKFFEKFNKREVARKLARIPKNKAEKKGVRYFLHQWKESADRGTRVHQQIEDYINLAVEPRLPMAWNAVTALNQLVSEFVSINGLEEEMAEAQVYSEADGLAGTIDYMGTNCEGEAILIDWKTNNKFSTEGYNGKKGIRLVSENLEDCHLTKYSLQLATYARIVEQGGWKVRNAYIVHLTDEDFTVYEVNLDEYMAWVDKLVEYDKALKEVLGLNLISGGIDSDNNRSDKMIELNDEEALWLRDLCRNEIQTYEQMKETSPESLKGLLYNYFEKSGGYIDFLRLLRDVDLRNYVLVDKKFYEVKKK